MKTTMLRPSQKQLLKECSSEIIESLMDATEIEAQCNLRMHIWGPAYMDVKDWTFQDDKDWSDRLVDTVKHDLEVGIDSEDLPKCRKTLENLKEAVCLLEKGLS